MSATAEPLSPASPAITAHSVLSPSDALEKATELVEGELQAHLKRHVQPVLQWPVVLDAAAHDFHRMLYVAEHGGNIKLERIHKAISAAMRGLIAFTSTLPAQGLPSQAILSIMPGSVLIKLEDTGLKRRLVCLVKVKAMLVHAKPSKLSVVLDGWSESDWQHDGAGTTVTGQQGVEEGTPVAWNMSTEEKQFIDAAMLSAASTDNKGWTFPTWQTSYSDNGSLVPIKPEPVAA